MGDEKNIYGIRILSNKDVSYEQFLEGIEKSLSVPGSFHTVPIVETRTSEEPREIIRELLSAIKAITFEMKDGRFSNFEQWICLDGYIGQAIAKAEEHLKEITGSPCPSEPVIIKNQEDSTND